MRPLSYKNVTPQLLVAEASATKRREVQKAKDQLEQTGTPFLGVILNKFNIQLENMVLTDHMGTMVPMGKNKKK